MHTDLTTADLVAARPVKELLTGVKVRATSVGVMVLTPGEVDVLEFLDTYLPTADPGSIRRVLEKCANRVDELEYAAMPPAEAVA